MVRPSIGFGNRSRLTLRATDSRVRIPSDFFPMATDSKHLISPEEYLAIERASPEKSEYLNGEIFAMGRESPRQVLIVTNLVAELGTQLKEHDCSVFSTNLRVLVSKTGLYTYPDVVVICNGLQYVDDFRDTIANPVLIIEVLSKSTQNYDRGQKFEHYRTFNSLMEYVLIAQDRIHVEHNVRQPDNSWLLSETGDINGIIELPTIKCRLSLTEIYDKVDQIKPD